MQDIPREIIAAAAEGDTGAFEKIYRATADYVYTIALRIVGNGADAEEVTQDVFLKVHRKLGRFRFDSSLSTWIHRIAVNNAISAVRRISRRRARQVEFDDAVSRSDCHAARRESLERERNELRVRSMLEALNPDQRACIVLREMQGMRYQEIADTLGTNINTVRSRLKRARETLLARHGHGG